MSRSNGDRSAVRPLNGRPSAAGSTRHSPSPPRPPPPRPPADMVGSIGISVAFCPGDTQRPEPPLAGGAWPPRRGRRRRRGTPARPGPRCAPTAPAGDRDLAAHQQELEHLGDVAVVRPAGGLPRHGGVRDVARDERAGSRSRLRMSRRNLSLSRIHARPLVDRAYSMAERGTGQVLMGRTMASNSNRVRSTSSACLSWSG